MALDEYQFVKYEPKYNRKIAELQQPLWGDDLALSEAYFEWKYLRNPYVKEPLIHLGLFKDKVVAMIGFFGALWEYGQPRKEMLCLSGADVVTHSDHRRKGVGETNAFYLLATIAQFNLYDYCIVLSANRLSNQGAVKNGWRSAGFLKNLHRLKSSETITHRAQRYAEKLSLPVKLKDQQAFDKLDKPKRDSENNQILISKEPRIPEMADLIERIGHDGRIRHVRDVNYLTWRYCNPMSQYRFLYFDEGRLEGYMVLRAPSAAKIDRSLVQIVDWEAKDLHIRQELLDTAIKWGDFDDLSVWTATLTKDELDIIINAGFEPFDEEKAAQDKFQYTQLLIRLMSYRTMDLWKENTNWCWDDYCLFDMKSWDLRGIYSEGY